MKTKTIEVCDCLHYDVSCEHNDSVDIKCGGPPILGYEFYIDPDENVNEMKSFIKSCLKKYHRPFIGIDITKVKDIPVKNLWTKHMIEECIKNISL